MSALGGGAETFCSIIVLRLMTLSRHERLTARYRAGAPKGESAPKTYAFLVGPIGGIMD